jgi:hypothetical protein
MVKPLPIMLSKVLDELLLGQAWWRTQLDGQGQDHSMTLRSGVANLTIKIKCMFNRDFGHYYDHHWKIMSHNVVKKMT